MAIDECLQPVCKDLTCIVNCDGVTRIPATHHVDECGVCLLLTVNISGSCAQDCAGLWSVLGPANHLDECGNCVPIATVRLPTCVQNCLGVWEATGITENCGRWFHV